MSLFRKRIGPVFLKENSDAEEFVAKMTELSNQADGDFKKSIETQIKLANYGIIGEKNIAFELKNSGMDMYILHDICFEFEGLRAQIDYILITQQRVYVIECKNLIGNIEIDNSGNFIRTYELSGKKIKEGLYSPITQNQRHLELIKNLRSPDNIIKKHFFEKHFNDTHRSLVVLSNPKTYLNAKFAPKDIKNKVIRADKLIAQIKEIDSTESCNFSNEEMLLLANFFLKQNIPDRSDYSLKYKEMMESLKDNSTTTITPSEQPIENANTKKCPHCGAEMVLRVAKKGENVGKEFFGCSAFPKCRYIENIEN